MGGGKDKEGGDRGGGIANSRDLPLSPTPLPAWLTAAHSTKTADEEIDVFITLARQGDTERNTQVHDEKQKEEKKQPTTTDNPDHYRNYTHTHGARPY